MSTSYYFECLAHDPVIQSDEISQHDDWNVKRAVRWAQGVEPLPDLDSLSGDYFGAQTASFLRQHPRCPLRIADEYGKLRAVEGRGEEEQRAALERDLLLQQELIRQAENAARAARVVASEAEALLAALEDPS